MIGGSPQHVGGAIERFSLLTRLSPPVYPVSHLTSNLTCKINIGDAHELLMNGKERKEVICSLMRSAVTEQRLSPSDK